MSGAVREALENFEDPACGDGPIEDHGGGEDFAGGAGWAGRREALPEDQDMPEDCPVTCLGTEGGTYHFLNALGEHRVLASDKVANKHILGMFAPYTIYLRQKWPRKKEIALTDENGKVLLDAAGHKLTEWIIVGWNTEVVTEVLMNNCARKGVWNAREKVRGRGAWKADDGSLVLHCGNAVLINGAWRPAGEHGKFVYPAQGEIPKPLAAGSYSAEKLMPRLVAAFRARGMQVGADWSPAHFLLAVIKTWSWDRGLVDPVLMLGWIMVAPFGGAVKYRPIVWPTGGRGTGKSELLEMIGGIFGNALIVSPKASEAGVRQVLGQQSLPVTLDESEAGKDNSKMAALIELARLAATSQGNIIKGGQDHNAHEFAARSCFLFTSILVPPLEPADQSRMGILEMNRLPAGSRSVGFDKYLDELGRLGAWLRKRFADNWARWPGLLELFEEALMGEGDQGSRAADQFGTLRAAAELALNDRDPEDEELSLWAGLLSRTSLAETADAPEEGETCLSLIRSRPVQLDMRGGQRLVGEWLMQATLPLEGNAEDPMGLLAKELRAKATAPLGRIGLKIVRWKKGDDVPECCWGEWLAVATNHAGLDQLLRESKFHEGVWTRALARLPGAVKSTRNGRLVRFAGHVSRCTLVPLAVALPPEDGEDEAGAVVLREMEGV